MRKRRSKVIGTGFVKVANISAILQVTSEAAMSNFTYSSRQFNQDISGAKKAAESGPVIITDRGRPAHVLMTFEAYRKLTGVRVNMADLLAMPGGEDMEFEVPPRPRDLARAAEFD
jgi:prevent-host-death family protein